MRTVIHLTRLSPKKISLRGHALLREPLLNKGSAFSTGERKAFGLDGLLPYRVLDIERQAQRIYAMLDRYPDAMGKYVALAALQDRNEHLYFYLLQQHLEEFLPIVYTPTIGLATKRFSQVFQRGRGAWITPDQQGAIAETLQRAAQGRDIRLIVATDNESILGIGDQGAGGIKISIGKLALYTAAAGINPASVLPISLDVGTQNQALLDQPGYLGWPHARLRGAEYAAFVDEFVAAVRQLFPHALIQWEDFRKDNALRIMDRYRDEVLSFNDDIQGTGAVALAGMLSAQRVHGRPLAGERILIVGAGAAGLGISRQIKVALAGAGLTGEDLQHAVAALDSQGLLVDTRVGDSYKAEMAWTQARAKALQLDGSGIGLLDVCRAFRPTVLIGTSGQRNAFSEAVVREIASTVERPVILPLSNPTDLSEAVPADLYAWSDGRALVAAGSPFPPVEYAGRTYQVGQGNNAFIFPGIGHGAILSGAASITDSMFYAGAKALARMVTDDELAGGSLYPAVDRLREASVEVAVAVIRDAAESGMIEPISDLEIQNLLDAGTWSPAYREYIPN
ncbi:MAG: NAD-dependent malic enzyme [Gammaproteobacteria bacterium]|nr:MAG: NAD-dependent malic enzyme [Gammaproteobacteria bacterium]